MYSWEGEGLVRSGRCAKLCRRAVVEGAVWPVVIEIGSPLLQFYPSVGYVEEDFDVQALVA